MIFSPAIAIALLCAFVVSLELPWPRHVENPGARASIDTVITIWALLSVGLLLATFKHTRRSRDLVLAGALAAVALTDVAFSAVLALTGSDLPASGTGALLACQALVAIAFAAAAFAPRGTVRRGGGRPIALAGIVSVGVVTLAQLFDVIAGSPPPLGASRQSGLPSAAHHPVSVVVAIGSSGLLVLAGIAFASRARPGDREARLLAPASFLLAGARAQYLALPTVPADWITPREGLRLAAHSLLLTVAVLKYAKSGRQAALEAVGAERQRIARDLHDGLAQDLAFIAAHGQRLESELGPEHPLTVAARRALAASRGTIVDLSASAALTTGVAVRQVANEVATRYDVQVRVQIDTGAQLSDAGDLQPSDREAIVRIAREAIVNAIRHGGARRVEVTLDYRESSLLLRVSDDGCGIRESALRSTYGFGLPMMRARAASLGSRLTTRRMASGGTEVEVLVLMGLPGGRCWRVESSIGRKRGQ